MTGHIGGCCCRMCQLFWGDNLPESETEIVIGSKLTNNQELVNEKPLRIFVLPKFEGLKDEKVFFPKAKINP